MKLIRWSGLVLICTLTVIPMNGSAHAQTNQTNMSSVHTDTRDTHFKQSGNVGNHAQFLLDESFLKSLDKGTVSFNGYQVVSNDDGKSTYNKHVFDQDITVIDSHSASSVRFSVANPSVSLQQMKDVYDASKLKHIPHTSNDAQYPDDGTYVYQGDATRLQFVVKKGYVSTVTVGQVNTEG